MPVQKNKKFSEIGSSKMNKGTWTVLSWKTKRYLFGLSQDATSRSERGRLMNQQNIYSHYSNVYYLLAMERNKYLCKNVIKNPVSG